MSLFPNHQYHDRLFTNPVCMLIKLFIGDKILIVQRGKFTNVLFEQPLCCFVLPNLFVNELLKYKAIADLHCNCKRVQSCKTLV